MRKTGVLSLAGALLIPVGAAAEPIVVSVSAARVFTVGGASPFSGFNVWRQVNVPGGASIDFNFSGDLFDPQPFLGLCSPCTAGQTFSPTLSISGDPIGRGAVTVGDHRDPAHRHWEGVAASGRFTFAGGSMMLPSDAPELFNILLPLTFSGAVSAFADGEEVVRVTPFSFSGRASVQFRTQADPDRGRLFTAEAFDFAGSNSTAPVPEPATLILLGGGLTSVWWHRRRSR